MSPPNLSGCPYSLPDDANIKSQVESILDAEQRVRERIANASEMLTEMGILGEFVAGQRTREIYESNSIEGLGPSLSQTGTILASEEAGKVSRAVETLQDHFFLESFARDKHLVEVLSLHGAKTLAESLLLEWKSGKRLSEVDIRSIHSLIATDEDYAGRYKRYHVRIGGPDAHEPILPIDTPAAMSQYVNWLDGSKGQLPPTLRAAIAHAWLTHIHPFEDGNGRLARIIANLVLAASGLPPAIVVSASQRESYIDALAHSDAGGDIMPLTGLMLKTLKQFARYSEKPATLRAIVREQVEQQSLGVFASWRTAFNAFMARFFGELRLNGIRVEEIDVLTKESFYLLGERNTAGSTWLFRFYLEDFELLVWMGYADSRIANHLDTEVRYPALQFAVPEERQYMLDPYRNAHPAEVGGVMQVCIAPGRVPHVYAISDLRLKHGSINDSANDLANRIRQGFELRRSRAGL